MLDLGQLFKRADTVQRQLAAPLARSRLAYLGHRAEEGAKPSTLRGIAALQVNLEWVKFAKHALWGLVTGSGKSVRFRL